MAAFERAPATVEKPYLKERKSEQRKEALGSGWLFLLSAFL